MSILVVANFGGEEIEGREDQYMPTGKPTKLKPCKICGELFLPDKPSTRYCSKDHYTECPVCGKKMIWNSMQAVPPCSKECRKEQTRLKNLAKYGCEHPMQNEEVKKRFEDSMMAKYGVAHALQSDQLLDKVKRTNEERFGTEWALANSEVQSKRRETLRQHYGVDHPMNSPEIREKIKETLLDRYGVENIMQSPQCRRNAQNTCRERYGVSNPAQYGPFHKKMEETRIRNNGQYWTEDMTEKAKISWMARYGVDNPSKSAIVQQKIDEVMLSKYGVRRAAQLGPVTSARISQTNKDFKSLLDSAGIPSEFELSIGRHAYDIALSGTNILIEIDPSYTHSTQTNHWGGHVAMDYHLKKTTIAREAGYRCIHVFDWDNPQSIVKLVQPKKRIGARKCALYKLNNRAADQFLNENHLQGTVRGQTLCLGLVYEGEIVQVMTFGNPRYDKSHAIELLRLASRSDLIVVGGAEKLFRWATDYFCLDDIISYCDLAKFSGDVYTRLGMKKIRQTDPQPVWSRGSDKITSNLLRQRGYDQIFNAHYGKGTDNETLMLLNGWLPVPDCGQAVYEFRKH